MLVLHIKFKWDVLYWRYWKRRILWVIFYMSTLYKLQLWRWLRCWKELEFLKFDLNCKLIKCCYRLCLPFKYLVNENKWSITQLTCCLLFVNLINVLTFWHFVLREQKQQRLTISSIFIQIITQIQFLVDKSCLVWH